MKVRSRVEIDRIARVVIRLSRVKVDIIRARDTRGYSIS